MADKSKVKMSALTRLTALVILELFLFSDFSLPLSRINYAHALVPAFKTNHLSEKANMKSMTTLAWAIIQASLRPGMTDGQLKTALHMIQVELGAKGIDIEWQVASQDPESLRDIYKVTITAGKDVRVCDLNYNMYENIYTVGELREEATEFVKTAPVAKIAAKPTASAQQANELQANLEKIESQLDGLVEQLEKVDPDYALRNLAPDKQPAHITELLNAIRDISGRWQNLIDELDKIDMALRGQEPAKTGILDEAVVPRHGVVPFIGEGEEPLASLNVDRLKNQGAPVMPGNETLWKIENVIMVVAKAHWIHFESSVKGSEEISGVDPEDAYGKWQIFVSPEDVNNALDILLSLASRGKLGKFKISQETKTNGHFEINIYTVKDKILDVAMTLARADTFNFRQAHYKTNAQTLRDWEKTSSAYAQTEKWTGHIYDLLKGVRTAAGLGEALKDIRAVLESFGMASAPTLADALFSQGAKQIAASHLVETQSPTVSGAMKELGLRDPTDEDETALSEEMVRKIEALARGKLGETIYGIDEQAVVVKADLGERKGADHLRRRDGTLIIVLNLRFSNPDEPDTLTGIQKEGLYHEAREAHWIKVLTEKYGEHVTVEVGGEGATLTVQHAAHIIAWAEQIGMFSENYTKPTSYQEFNLNAMDNSELEVIAKESEIRRNVHHKILELANMLGANLDIETIKTFENDIVRTGAQIRLGAKRISSTPLAARSRIRERLAAEGILPRADAVLVELLDIIDENLGRLNIELVSLGKLQQQAQSQTAPQSAANGTLASRISSRQALQGLEQDIAQSKAVILNIREQLQERRAKLRGYQIGLLKKQQNKEDAEKLIEILNEYIQEIRTAELAQLSIMLQNPEANAIELGIPEKKTMYYKANTVRASGKWSDTLWDSIGNYNDTAFEVSQNGKRVFVIAVKDKKQAWLYIIDETGRISRLESREFEVAQGAQGTIFGAVSIALEPMKWEARGFSEIQATLSVINNTNTETTIRQVPIHRLQEILGITSALAIPGTFYYRDFIVEQLEALIAEPESLVATPADVGRGKQQAKIRANSILMKNEGFRKGIAQALIASGVKPEDFETYLNTTRRGMDIGDREARVRDVYLGALQRLEVDLLYMDVAAKIEMENAVLANMRELEKETAEIKAKSASKQLVVPSPAAASEDRISFDGRVYSLKNPHLPFSFKLGERLVNFVFRDGHFMVLDGPDILAVLDKKGPHILRGHNITITITDKTMVLTNNEPAIQIIPLVFDAHEASLVRAIAILLEDETKFDEAVGLLKEQSVDTHVTSESAMRFINAFIEYREVSLTRNEARIKATKFSQALNMLIGRVPADLFRAYFGAPSSAQRSLETTDKLELLKTLAAQAAGLVKLDANKPYSIIKSDLRIAPVTFRIGETNFVIFPFWGEDYYLANLYDQRKARTLKGKITLGHAGDNAVVAEDEYVSGHHAEIEERGGEFIFTDLGSRNGTEGYFSIEEVRLVKAMVMLLNGGQIDNAVKALKGESLFEPINPEEAGIYLRARREYKKAGSKREQAVSSFYQVRERLRGELDKEKNEDLLRRYFKAENSAQITIAMRHKRQWLETLEAKLTPAAFETAAFHLTEQSDPYNSPLREHAGKTYEVIADGKSFATAKTIKEDYCDNNYQPITVHGVTVRVANNITETGFTADKIRQMLEEEFTPDEMTQLSPKGDPLRIVAVDKSPGAVLGGDCVGNKLVLLSKGLSKIENPTARRIMAQATLRHEIRRHELTGETAHTDEGDADDVEYIISLAGQKGISIIAELEGILSGTRLLGMLQARLQTEVEKAQSTAPAQALSVQGLIFDKIAQSRVRAILEAVNTANEGIPVVKEKGINDVNQHQWKYFHSNSGRFNIYASEELAVEPLVQELEKFVARLGGLFNINVTNLEEVKIVITPLDYLEGITAAYYDRGTRTIIIPFDEISRFMREEMSHWFTWSMVSEVRSPFVMFSEGIAYWAAYEADPEHTDNYHIKIAALRDYYQETQQKLELVSEFEEYTVYGMIGAHLFHRIHTVYGINKVLELWSAAARADENMTLRELFAQVGLDYNTVEKDWRESIPIAQTAQATAEAAVPVQVIGLTKVETIFETAKLLYVQDVERGNKALDKINAKTANIDIDVTKERRIDAVAILVNDEQFEQIRRTAHAANLRIESKVVPLEMHVFEYTIHLDDGKRIDIIRIAPNAPKDNRTVQSLTNFLAKNPDGAIHHIEYFTDNVVSTGGLLKTAGFDMAYEKPVVGAGGVTINFLPLIEIGTDDKMLIELVQEVHVEVIDLDNLSLEQRMALSKEVGERLGLTDMWLRNLIQGSMIGKGGVGGIITARNRNNELLGISVFPTTKEGFKPYIYIRDDYSGQGIGTAMLTTRLTYLVERLHNWQTEFNIIEKNREARHLWLKLQRLYGFNMSPSFTEDTSQDLLVTCDLSESAFSGQLPKESLTTEAPAALVVARSPESQAMYDMVYGNEQLRNGLTNIQTAFEGEQVTIKCSVDTLRSIADLMNFIESLPQGVKKIRLLVYTPLELEDEVFRVYEEYLKGNFKKQLGLSERVEIKLVMTKGNIDNSDSIRQITSEEREEGIQFIITDGLVNAQALKSVLDDDQVLKTDTNTFVFMREEGAQPFFISWAFKDGRPQQISIFTGEDANAIKSSQFEMSVFEKYRQQI